MSGDRDAQVAIGFGNPWLSDDGVGLRVIEELHRVAARRPTALPPGTRLVAAGTPSLDLLATIRDVRALVLVDAVDLGATPGSVHAIVGDAVSATLGRGEIGDLLTAARLTGCLPDAIALVGIQVGTIGTGDTLSGPVEAAVPGAVDRSIRELAMLASRTSTASGRRTEPVLPAEGVWA